MTDFPVLDFTGERFTPECPRAIWYEHWHRYAWVLPLMRGRRVLDAACGEGYGSALLATEAVTVTGLDLDRETIAHAARRYAGCDHLRFIEGSVTDIDLPDAAVDVVVSFETIEHLLEQETMLDEFRRVLAPDGILVLSSPDRDEYNAGNAERNPFHIRELDREELLALIRPRFPAVSLYGQRLGFHSLVWSHDQPVAGGPVQGLAMDAGTGRLGPYPAGAPVYYLALCAAHSRHLPTLPALSLFADTQQSILSHYNAEIARLIQADHRLAALERELRELRARLGATS